MAAITTELISGKVFGAAVRTDEYQLDLRTYGRISWNPGFSVWHLGHFILFLLKR